MNEKNKREFIFECREFLSAQSLASLRSYGREVGVVSPTSRKKGELIEEIIGVLSEDIPAQARSGRGAPVLDDRPDMKIVQEIERLKAKYDEAETSEGGQRVPNFDFSAMMANLKKKPTTFVLNCAGDFECYEDGSPKLFKGQLATQNGVSFLLPLDYLNDEDKMLIAIDFIRGYRLKEGDVITCCVKRTEQIAVVVRIEEINGVKPDFFTRTVHFEESGVRYPIGKIKTYDGALSASATAKYMDWVVPFGRGNRGLLIAPPKTGKTVFLEKVCAGATQLNDDVTTLALLIDQSPEAVGQFRKILSKDALVYSTYEDEPERQVFVAEYLLKRAKRLAECGKDVLLIVDSLSALAHAYNETEESSGGKMLPCGLESKTLHYVKKFLGAARCLENGGSLTIFGAVSNMTGNPADDLIAAELSSVCNLEIRLKEDLAARRIFPAVGADSVYVQYSEEGRGEPEVLALLRQVNPAKLSGAQFLSYMEKSVSQEEFKDILKKLRT